MNNYTSENKIAWESIAPIHAKALKSKRKLIIENFEFIPIHDVIVKYLSNIDIIGKSCLHLCCNNGFETIGLKRKGANECVGVDFCEYNIRYANELSKELNCSDTVKYMQANVTDDNLVKIINKVFDVIYISTGSLCWIDNLDALYKNISQLLKPGGKVIICDMHPMCSIVNDNKHIDKHPLLVVKHYFAKEPSTCVRSLDYISRSSCEKQMYHMFTHTFSDIIQNALAHKLQLNFLDETEIDVSGGFSRIKSLNFHFPLYFCIILQKMFSEDEYECSKEKQ